MVLPDFQKEKAEVAAILGRPWDESVPAGMDNPATDAKGNVTGGFTKCCRTEGPWDRLPPSWGCLGQIIAISGPLGRGRASRHGQPGGPMLQPWAQTMGVGVGMRGYTCACGCMCMCVEKLGLDGCERVARGAMSG